MPEGYLCVCQCCGREERTKPNPMKEGWPECCGAGMALIETRRFAGDVDQLIEEIFAPLRAVKEQL
jgi:hypothetical protein